MSEPGLFDAPAPTVDPDRYAGLNADAKRTAQQRDMIGAGQNPGTHMPIHAKAATGKTGTGLRCRDCAHLYRKTGHFQGAFLKCDKTSIRSDVHSTGPDMRAWWPACTLFDPRPEGDAGER